MDSTRLASDPEKQTQKSEGRVKTGIMYAAAIKEICNPQGQYVHIWNKMFVISCVFAVSLDPLFFYIPIIDQQNKCLQMDKVLQTVALILRSLTDVIFLLHFICEICDGLKTQTKKKSPPSTSETKLASDTPKTTAPNTQSNGHSNSKVETGEHSGPKSKKRLIGVAQEFMPWLSVSIIIDFFALLPIPQLLIVVTSDKMRGFGYLEHKKVMNILLLGQYLPRMYRIHISSKELKRTTGIWVKGLFNFFLYILASHILGAFWYFFSIQREISCWHQTCVNHSIDSAQCINTVYCNGQTTTSRNITFVNEHCPLDTPDNATSSFNFGIFLDSLKNQNTEHIKFGKKFFYSFWWGLRNLSVQMKTLFISLDLWEIVEDGYEEQETSKAGKETQEKQQTYKENKKKDAKALFLIQQGVSKNLFPRLLPATTSKQAWEILKIEFKGSEKVISIKLQSLWREFDNLFMKDSESIQVFFTKVSGIVNQIRCYGDTIPDKKIVEKTLRSLPPKYDHVAAAIEESKDLSTLSLHELIGSLEAREKRINRST